MTDQELARVPEESAFRDDSDAPEPDDIRWIEDNSGDLWCRESDGLWTCRSQPGARRRPWEDLLWKYGHLREPTEEEVESFLREEAESRHLREIDEAVAKLDAIGPDGDVSPETAHIEADKVLLSAVPADVRAAYERLRERSGGF